MAGFIKRRIAVSEFTLETAKSQQQCIEALRQQVKPPLPWIMSDFFASRDSYSGTVSDDGRFSIWRAVTPHDVSEEEAGKLRTSTPLQATGEIAPHASGALIHIVLRPRPFSRGIAWLLYAIGLFSVFGTFGSLLDPDTNVARFAALMALAIGWIALGWFLSRYVSADYFEAERVRAQEYLRRLFAAEGVSFGPQHGKR